jgi:hypothetical protein
MFQPYQAVFGRIKMVRDKRELTSKFPAVGDRIINEGRTGRKYIKTYLCPEAIKRIIIIF